MMDGPTFRFIIGPSGRVFDVHVIALEKTSKVLKILAQGPMSEAQEGQVILEDCSELVFERFCRFAYVGDYYYPSKGTEEETPPVPKNSTGVVEQEKLVSNEATELATQPSFSRYAATVPASLSGCKSEVPYSVRPEPNVVFPVMPRSTKKKTNPTNPWNIFLCAKYGESDVPFFPPRNSRFVNFYEPLMCHAELYVFADRYDIPTLRDMCLYRLHQTLISFTVYWERLGDIVRLIEYVYDNTCLRSAETGTTDKLRDMLSHFVYTTLDDFMQCEEFKERLLRLQPFMKDVMYNILKSQRLLEYRLGKCGK